MGLKIRSIEVKIRQLSHHGGSYSVDVSARINSTYLGRHVYTYTSVLSENDFDDMFSMMLAYAQEQIRTAVMEDNLARLKELYGKNRLKK